MKAKTVRKPGLKAAAPKSAIKPEYIAGAVGLLVVGYALYKKSKNDSIAPVQDAPATQQPAAGNSNSNTSGNNTPVALNQNVTLKKGSQGNEVKQLQQWLDITADGIFGAQTEAALFAKKGVKQITLAAYPKTANINNNALSIGMRVMANVKPGTPVTSVITLANGNLSNTKEYLMTFAYGKEIGKIISITADKNSYVVLAKDPFLGAFDVKVWVNAAQVAKI